MELKRATDATDATVAPTMARFVKNDFVEDIIWDEKTGLPILVFLHYPPVYGNQVCEEIFAVLKEHNIKKVFNGHIHGAGFNNAVKSYDGVDFELISCDCIDFTPRFIV